MYERCIYIPKIASLVKPKVSQQILNKMQRIHSLIRQYNYNAVCEKYHVPAMCIGSTVGSFVGAWYMYRNEKEPVLVNKIFGSIMGATIGFTGGFILTIGHPLLVFLIPSVPVYAIQMKQYKKREEAVV